MENEVVSLRGLSHTRGLSGLSAKTMQGSSAPQKSITTSLKAGESETKRRAFGDITNSSNGTGSGKAGLGTGSGKAGLGGVRGLSHQTKDFTVPKVGATGSTKGLAKMTIFEDGDVEVMHNAKVVPLPSDLLMETPAFFAKNLAGITSLERTEIFAELESELADDFGTTADGGWDSAAADAGDAIDMDLDF
jgi:hypothetical protein